MPYTPSTEPLQYDALQPLRPQRAEAAGDLAGLVAQFRLRQVRGIRCARSAARPSISASPISISPTIMGRRRARRRSLSATSFARDFRGLRDELVISTKAGYDMWPGPYGEWGGRKYMLASLDQSLKRMGLDYVDIFYSHRFDPETPLEETMGALDYRGAPGQGALCRHFVLQFAPHQGGRGDPEAARHALPHPPAELFDGQSLDRGRRPARHARSRGDRRDRVLAAGARAADRQISERRSERSRATTAISSTVDAHAAKHRARAPSRRDRQAARPDARPDGARLGADATSG